MATQTGSIDLKSAKKAHDDASKYITKIDDSGIKVHSYNDTTQQADTSNYAKIDGDGFEVVKNGGSVATFGEATRIGKTNQSRIEMDYHSMKLVDKDTNTYFFVSDLRDSDGNITETFTGDGTTKSFTVGATVINAGTVKVDGVTKSYSRSGQTFTLSSAPADGSEITIKYTPQTSNIYKMYTFGIRASNDGRGFMSVVEGSSTANGQWSHSEGYMSDAEGTCAHAEGFLTIARGTNSHAEGSQAHADGGMSHAEGQSTVATGTESHAEGFGTTAIGAYSHTEGKNSSAGGKGGHAEGFDTSALVFGHAQNVGTKAHKVGQTAIGTFNIEDTATTGTHSSMTADSSSYASSDFGQFALIVGNGKSDSNRSDALEVSWDGNVYLALDTNAGSGTDHDLYAAITALGWGSDVIV